MHYECRWVPPNQKAPSTPSRDTSRPTREEAQSIADALNRETRGQVGHYIVKKMEVTWYCSRGCNSFISTSYDESDPPECGSCGAPMTVERESYDDSLAAIEAAQIAEY